MRTACLEAFIAGFAFCNIETRTVVNEWNFSFADWKFSVTIGGRK